MKALRRQLMAAIAMVLVATIALGSSTYAWFAVNSKVTATGMEVTTKVSNNLLIASSSLVQTAKEAESAFKTSMDVSILDGQLEPVSTIDGVNFFWNSTKNVDGAGDAVSNTFTSLNGDGSTDTSFNNNYGTTGAKGYVDYVFQLKAINSGADTAYINLTALNLVYGGSESAAKAFRTAMFVWDMGADGKTAADAAATTAKQQTILADSAAKYFTENTAVKGTTGTDAYGSVSKYKTAANIGSVAGGETRYYKVVVRLWLEGEDDTCNNTTYAALQDKWAMNLTIELANATGGVTAITQSVTAAKVDISTTTTAAGTSTVIDGVTYYQIGATGDLASYYVKGSTTIASTSVIYQIVDGHPIDVTNQCTLPAATPGT